MRVQIWICQVILMLFGSPEAYADWQYTHWGMSPAEAVKASNGALGLASDPNQKGDLGATGTFTTGDYNFVARLFFKGGALSAVSLEIKGDTPKCRALAQDLAGKYGAPIATVEPPSSYLGKWADAKNNNSVLYLGSYFQNDQECHLSYTPLTSKGAGGL